MVARAVESLFSSSSTRVPKVMKLRRSVSNWLVAGRRDRTGLYDLPLKERAGFSEINRLGRSSRVGLLSPRIVRLLIKTAPATSS